MASSWQALRGPAAVSGGSVSSQLPLLQSVEGAGSQDLLPGCLETGRDPPQGQTGRRGPAPCQWVGLTLKRVLLRGIPDLLAELPCPTLSPEALLLRTLLWILAQRPPAQLCVQGTRPNSSKPWGVGIKPVGTRSTKGCQDWVSPAQTSPDLGSPGPVLCQFKHKLDSGPLQTGSKVGLLTPFLTPGVWVECCPPKFMLKP